MTNIPINEALYIIEKNNINLLKFFQKSSKYISRKELDGGAILGLNDNNENATNWYLERLIIIKNALLIQTDKLKELNLKNKRKERNVSNITLVSKIFAVVSNSTLLIMLINKLSTDNIFVIFFPAGIALLCNILPIILDYIKKKYTSLCRIITEADDKIRSMDSLEIDLKMFEINPILLEKATTILNEANNQISKIDYIINEI